MPARQNEERAPMIAPWLRLASDTTLLAFEAQTVIGLRLGQIATGRGTPAETQLMVTEKVLAFAEAGRARRATPSADPNRAEAGALRL
jgi:hypothetical protein